MMPKDSERKATQKLVARIYKQHQKTGVLPDSRAIEKKAMKIAQHTDRRRR